MRNAEQDFLDVILVEAADWHLRVQNAPGDAGVRADLKAWLAADPRHAQAWRLAEQAWLVSGIALNAGTTIPRQTRRRLRTGGAVAALALAACLALMVMLPGGMMRWSADHHTGIGETRQIVLSDGSTMTLGADSAVSVEYSEHRRAVSLLQGQAFFEVTSNPVRPFAVDADGIDVVVTGTAFDVALAAGAVSVAVVEGSVSVGGPGGQQDLNAGDRLSVDVASGRTERGTTASAEVASWRGGWLYVSDAPLDHVVAALRRHHHGLIVVRGDGLASRRVTGAYNLRDARRAVQTLAASHGVEVYEVSPYILILSAS